MPRRAQPYTADKESLTAATLLRQRNVDVFEIFFKYDAYCVAALSRQLFDVPRQDIENFVGDGMLRAFKRGDKYNPERAPVRIWLLWHARIEAIEFLRKHRPHVLKSLEITTDIAVQDADIDPEASVKARHLIQAMLASLPERQRAVLQLQLEDYPDSEIAKVLGITEATVRVHRKRAIDRLKESQKE